MMTSAVSLKPFKKYWNQQPRSYVPGVLLQRVCRDLGGRFTVVSNRDREVDLVENQGRIKCALEERIEAHFMMYVTAVRISCEIPGPQLWPGSVTITNSGWLRSRGVRCRAGRAAGQDLQSVCQALEQDKNLATALNGLHFRRCEIVATEQGWQLVLEPFGGSEVVNRLPSFRRYLRLEQQQVDYLVLALLAFKRILSNL